MKGSLLSLYDAHYGDLNVLMQSNGSILVVISGPRDQRWSNVVKETTRGGGVRVCVCMCVLKRPLSAAVRLKLPSFNSQTASSQRAPH